MSQIWQFRHFAFTRMYVDMSTRGVFAGYRYPIHCAISTGTVSIAPSHLKPRAPSARVHRHISCMFGALLWSHRTVEHLVSVSALSAHDIESIV